MARAATVEPSHRGRRCGERDVQPQHRVRAAPVRQHCRNGRHHQDGIGVKRVAGYRPLRVVQRRYQR